MQMRLWRKLSLLGKAFTNRAELEDKLTRELFELQELESNLKGQLKAIESSQQILQRDRENLQQITDFMESLKMTVVVNMRDWKETQDTIVAMGRSLRRQESQLNDATGIVRTLHSKLEAGLARADIVKTELKSLGKVIPWTKLKI